MVIQVLLYILKCSVCNPSSFSSNLKRFVIQKIFSAILLSIILFYHFQHETDSESIDTDNSVTTFYTLQYASTGKQNHEDYDESSLVFNTLYMGEETQYFMPEVDTNIGLYFRVCKSYFEGEYGPWSLTKKAWTTLPHHGLSILNIPTCTIIHKILNYFTNSFTKSKLLQSFHLFLNFIANISGSFFNFADSFFSVLMQNKNCSRFYLELRMSIFFFNLVL